MLINSQQAKSFCERGCCRRAKTSRRCAREFRPIQVDVVYGQHRHTTTPIRRFHCDVLYAGVLAGKVCEWVCLRVLFVLLPMFYDDISCVVRSVRETNVERSAHETAVNHDLSHDLRGISIFSPGLLSSESCSVVIINEMSLILLRRLCRSDSVSRTCDSCAPTRGYN